MRTTAELLLASALTLLSAAAVSAQEYYADIRPVLVDNCMGCHSETSVGWSMENPEDAYRRRVQIARAVDRRVMPPWLAEPGHQSYRDDLSLDESTLALVRRWAKGGFAKGEPRPDPAPHLARRAFEPDRTLEVLGAPSYLPNQERSDDYRCFVVDWEETGETFVTGFRARPGNLRVAHHTVVFAVQPDMAQRFKELAAEEDGLGYQCFGGAVPDRLGDKAEREAYEQRYPDGVKELNQGSYWLAHWAPGMNGNVFPEGTGLRMKPGSALVVQMHYYTGDAPGEPDANTVLDFQLAPTVDRPAMHLPQTMNRWLAGEDNESMVIGPRQMATYQVTDNLGDLMGYIASVTDVDEDRIESLEIYSANLHMHAIGHSGVVSLIDENGRTETLLSIPRWDLDWQRDFAFTEPKVFDRKQLERTALSVQCTFENPNDHVVYGGFGSYDEMCFNFSYIAVRTGDHVAEEGPSR